MSVQRAMIEAPFTANPDNTVKEIINLLSEKHVRAVPVTDESGTLVGLITLRLLLKNLLPVSASMEGGIDNLDFLVGTTAGAAKKLKKILDRPISDFMTTEYHFVDIETSKWEAIRLMVKSNTILPVVDNDEDKKLLGVLTAQATLSELTNVMKEIEDGKYQETEE